MKLLPPVDSRDKNASDKADMYRGFIERLFGIECVCAQQFPPSLQFIN